MRPVRTLRHLLTAAVVALLAGTLLPLGPVAAEPAAPAPDPLVRLVVRTATKAAGREVLAAATARGATPAGRVRALRAVAVELPRSQVPRLTRQLLRRADVIRVDMARERWLSEEPADARFAEQRTYFDAVRATTAWGRPAHGSPAVRIAVIDSGVDVAHPDLAGKVAGTHNAVTRGTDVRDLVGHGTAVASVAAAATNNGEGMAGAGYDSALLAVKVADRTGRIFTDDLAAGIVWATNQGARVVNLSLGGPTTDPLERDAVAYAVRRGVLVVAAAGNDGTRQQQFPAALPGVLSVGATLADGSARASFSSFGSWVDVAAPGRGLLAAAAGGGYQKVDGTSFAAPLVSGQAALLEAYRPGRTGADLAAAVIGGANTAKLGFARGLVDFDASLDLLPPASAPALTAPADGATVAGQVTVAATSTAAQVRFGLGDLTATVPTSGGAAAATFPTYGLDGPTAVTATDCSRIGQCAAASARGSAVVANPAPALTAPAEGADASADRLTIAAEAPPDAGVRFLVDGRPVATDLTAPFRADTSTQRLGDGSHTVTAVLCRSDGSVCAPAGGSATVTVDRLHPRLTELTRRAISPDGDGRRDTTRLTYRLDQRADVALEVRAGADGAGRLLLRRPLGRQPAGTHAVTWDGRARDRAVRDRAVRDGVVTVGVSTTAGDQRGLATTTVTVDRSEPAVRDVRRGARQVLPVRDGYRDTVPVTGRVGEDVRWVRVEARGPGGLVESRKLRRVAPGPVTVPWTARRADGSPVPVGRWSVRLVAADAAGNVGRSAAVTVQVSGQRLTRRTGSISVTARESLDEVFADECSLVFRHARGERRGWVGYFSSGTCSSPDAYAVGDHQVRLPRAVRYGTVQISAFGGRGDRRYRDSARLTYYDRYQNLSRHMVRLRPAVGTYTGPRVAAERLLVRRRVLRWSTMTTKVAWYDVERYTVRYTYFVLR